MHIFIKFINILIYIFIELKYQYINKINILNNMQYVDQIRYSIENKCRQKQAVGS